METDRENPVPGQLWIISKLDEGWPLPKESVILLRLLKAFKTLKERHHCLTTAKVFNTEKKDSVTFFTTLKVFNTEKKGLRHIFYDS